MTESYASSWQSFLPILLLSPTVEALTELCRPLLATLLLVGANQKFSKNFAMVFQLSALYYCYIYFCAPTSGSQKLSLV